MATLFKPTISPRGIEEDSDRSPHRLPLARRLPDHIRNHFVAM